MQYTVITSLFLIHTFETERDNVFTFALSVCCHFRRNNKTTSVGGEQRSLLAGLLNTND